MKGRTVLITGASSGLGAEFASAYAMRGANLVLVARRTDRLEALASDLKNTYGTKSDCLGADLSSAEAVDSLLAQLKTMTIDGLINNAGFSVATDFTHATWSQQADFIQVCVTTPAALCHTLLPDMMARNFGRIINVSSVTAFSNGAAGHTLYPAAKSFVLKMSRSLAAETKGFDIKITALCPGSTRSDFHAANGMTEVVNAKPIPFVMDTRPVIEAAINGNEKGREVVIPGLFNQISAAFMTKVPDILSTPLTRRAAKAYKL